MKINNRIIDITLLVIWIITTLLLYFQRKIFPCGLNYLGIILIIFLVIMALILNLLLKRNKVQNNRFYIVAFATLFLGVISVKNFQKNTIQDLIQDGGGVTTASVYEKFAYYNSPYKIYVKYFVDGTITKKSYACEKEVYNSISVKDTILLVYSIKCSDRSIPYKYFPTSEEIERCKDGCYYLGGKIEESLPPERRLSK